MNPISIVFSVLGLLFTIFVVRLLSLSSLGGTSPWWVYFIFLGILFSGIMFVYSLIEDKREEEEVIEREGQIFLEKYKSGRQDVKQENKENTERHVGATHEIEDEWRHYSI